MFAVDHKFAFELREKDQPSVTFVASSQPDKIEWMAALTSVLTRRCDCFDYRVAVKLNDLYSTYERLLDAKLREMEQNIRIILPKPTEYRYVLIYFVFH